MLRDGDLGAITVWRWSLTRASEGRRGSTLARRGVLVKRVLRVRRTVTAGLAIRVAICLEGSPDIMNALMLVMAEEKRELWASRWPASEASLSLLCAMRRRVKATPEFAARALPEMDRNQSEARNLIIHSRASKPPIIISWRISLKGSHHLSHKANRTPKV